MTERVYRLAETRTARLAMARRSVSNRDGLLRGLICLEGNDQAASKGLSGLIELVEFGAVTGVEDASHLDLVAVQFAGQLGLLQPGFFPGVIDGSLCGHRGWKSDGVLALSSLAGDGQILLVLHSSGDDYLNGVCRQLQRFFDAGAGGDDFWQIAHGDDKVTVFFMDRDAVRPDGVLGHGILSTMLVALLASGVKGSGPRLEIGGVHSDLFEEPSYAVRGQFVLESGNLAPHGDPVVRSVPLLLVDLEADASFPAVFPKGSDQLVSIHSLAPLSMEVIISNKNVRSSEIEQKCSELWGHA